MIRSTPTRRLATPRRPRAFLPLAEGLEGRQLLSAGQLDLTFGTSGYTLAAAATSGARAVQIQRDGKILAAGTYVGSNTSIAIYNFRLARLNPDGSLDSTFGSSGVVTTDFAGDTDALRDMAILPDNRIVLAGEVRGVQTLIVNGKKQTFSDIDIGLACYLAADTTINGTPYKAGDLDPTFGSGGKVRTDINDWDSPYGVIVQEDGKIVVGSWTKMTSTSTVWDGVLARYDTNGTLDPTFGTSGIVQIHLANYPSSGVMDLALLRDPTNPANDKIVATERVSANGQDSLMVARFNLDGSPDSTWGTNGQSTNAASLAGEGMALQPDGSVVVTGGNAGTTGGGFLARYTNTGQLDPNFDGDGIAFFGAATGDGPHSVAIQSNGRIVVAGDSNTAPGSFVARFDNGGAVDTTFGTNGFARDIFTNAYSSFKGIALQSDGKIVAAGGGAVTTGSGRKATTTPYFLIARYQGDTVATPSASTALTGGATSFGPSAATGQPEVLIPLTDHDLSQLATEIIQIRPKRRGALSSGFALLRGGL